MDAITGFVGRDSETALALEALGRGVNVLVTGRAGIGKSAFLAQLRERVAAADDAPPTAWVPSGTTKTALVELARQLHETEGLAMPEEHIPAKYRGRARRENWLPWDHLARTMRRLPATEAVDIIIATLRRRRFLLFLESLEVPPSQAELFASIAEHAQLAAAMDERNRRVRIDRLLWRFQERIELKPLTLEQCETIAVRWLDANPLRFSDDVTRRRFVRHVAQDSGGVPAAIRGMLEAARKEPEITPAKARGFAHEAGIRYVDMTPLLVLLVVIAMAGRYISRGLGEVEMLVLSGVATALFMGLRFLLWQMRGR